MVLRLASTTGAAALLLLAGCERPAATMATTAAPASSPHVDTVAAADADRDATPTTARVAFGAGIRPTGSTANGITP